jgi:hypothetical protein
MDDINDLHRVGVFEHAVDDDEGQRRQRQFARTIDSANPSAMGKGSNHGEAFVNRLAQAPPNVRILPANIAHNAFEVVRGVG